MLFLFLAVFSSPTFEVVREKEFNKSKQIVWHKFSRFKHWKNWSSWNDQDTSISYKYSGKQGREGAKMTWSGNSIGSGSMIVTKIIPFKELVYELKLSESNSIHKGQILLSETPKGTFVRWKLSGTLSFWMRPFGSLGFFDSTIGGDLEQGLEKISIQFEK